MRRTTAMLACSLCLLPLACGSPEDDAPDEPLAEVRDTLGEDTAVGPDPEPGEVLPPDRMDIEGGDPAVGVEDEDVGGDGAVRPGEGASALPEWTTGTVVWDPPQRPRTPVIESLRVGRSEGYDRWVVEMREGSVVPGYRVEYIDRPLHECGSGEQIHPVGDGWLEVRLEPAQAHTDEGQATLTVRERDTPALTRGLKVYRTCDFEAIVTFVLAVDSPEPFRVFHLSDPARVVVDVRH